MTPIYLNMAVFFNIQQPTTPYFTMKTRLWPYVGAAGLLCHKRGVRRARLNNWLISEDKRGAMLYGWIWAVGEGTRTPAQEEAFYLILQVCGKSWFLTAAFNWLFCLMYIPQKWLQLWSHYGDNEVTWSSIIITTASNCLNNVWTCLLVSEWVWE